MGNVSRGWTDALGGTQTLLAAFKVKFPKFNEALHPRGADGRFISKGGRVKWLDHKSGAWMTGDVESFNGNLVNVIRASDKQKRTFTANNLYQAKSPVATMPSKSKLNKISGPAGSNPGGLYIDPQDQSKYYIKTPKTVGHAINELIAHKLYAAVGVATPVVGLSSDKSQFYSKIEDSLPWNQVPSESKTHAINEIRQNFVIDAWLANWDAPSTDNIRVTKDGVPLRVDTGGALDYRAKGASKVSTLTPKVSELKDMVNPHINSSGALLYANVTAAQEEDGVKRILALSPSAIKDLVISEGGPKRLADDLIARRAWLATHYGYTLPESTPEGKAILDTQKTDQSVQEPSLAPAISKLKPGEKPPIVDGSPVWLQNKKPYKDAAPGALPDVWTVDSTGNTDVVDLKTKNGKKLVGVHKDDLVPLTENHAAWDAFYSDGETSPEIGDLVSLTNGSEGEINALYPKYAKVKLDTGEFKTLAIKNLTHKKLEENKDTSKSDKEPSNTNSPLYYDKNGENKYKPEYALLQQKYRAAAVAKYQNEGDNHTDDMSAVLSISPETLIPTQPETTSNTSGSGAGPSNTPPIVLKKDKKYYLLDGHHRMMDEKNKQVTQVYVVKSEYFDQKHDDSANKNATQSWIDDLLGYETGYTDNPSADTQSVPNWSNDWKNHSWKDDPQPEVRTLNSHEYGKIEVYAPGMPAAVVKFGDSTAFVDINVLEKQV